MIPSPNQDPQSEISNLKSEIPHSQLTTRYSQLLTFRPYQLQAFNSQTGIELWLWARQTGKSYTLAAWAIHRLLTRPGRLVTILSNSKTNGIELNKKIADICYKLNHPYEQFDFASQSQISNFKSPIISSFETYNTETRITTGTAGILPATGRIKILAANPRTARGFSGDLILDEFAFHENAQAIWEAAEPILAANPDYLCRIASTPNGKHNLFYQLATSGTIPTRKVTRTDAYTQGCQIYHPITRAPITPAEARNLAPNKSAYDQNYECAFENQNMALLTHDLITSAERSNVGIICHQDWTNEALSFLDCRRRREESLTFSLRSTNSNPESNTHVVPASAGSLPSEISNLKSEIPPNEKCQMLNAHCSMNSAATGTAGILPASSHLYAGIDVARHHDQTVITILEKQGPLHLIRAILRLKDMRLPDQQQRLNQILSLPNLIHAKIDTTGLGLGLYEYTHAKFPNKITGLNFASTIPLSSLCASVPLWLNNSPSQSTQSSVRITEHLATQLLQTYEDHAIHQPIDNDLREDLRKPERLISPSGRVSIAATRDSNGHADHFWSLALAIDAAKNTPRPPIYSTPVEIRFSRTGSRPGRAHRKHHFHR